MFGCINTHSQQADVLILSSPLTVTAEPLAAAAVLKSIAELAGYSCATVDLNIITMRWLINNFHKNKFIEFFKTGVCSNEIKDEIETYTTNVLSLIKRFNCKIIGISVFTFHSRPYTEILCKKIKQHFPSIKIVLGGAGITAAAAGIAEWAEQLLMQESIDFYIQGDAEHSWYEFLKGNYDFPGINGTPWTQLKNTELEQVPYPNYDDYDWGLYGSNLYIPYNQISNRNSEIDMSLMRIPITGSRGCVRNCKFCDFIITHKNFTWRNAENIFSEMKHQSQKYKINHFAFTDSLINGNMKEYLKLTSMLSEYNKDKNQVDKIKWTSQFILKPSHSFKEDMWKLTAQSGAYGLHIGIESIDDQVRKELGKDFTNDDIEFSLQMMAKYKIGCSLMLFTGYPTETQKTYDNVESWFQRWLPYKDTLNFHFVGTMVLIKDSYLDKNRKVYSIMVDPVKENAIDGITWSWTTANKNNTAELRNKWLQDIKNCAINMGFVVTDHSSTDVMIDQISVLFPLR